MPAGSVPCFSWLARCDSPGTEVAAARWLRKAPAGVCVVNRERPTSLTEGKVGPTRHPTHFGEREWHCRAERGARGVSKCRLDLGDRGQVRARAPALPERPDRFVPAMREQHLVESLPLVESVVLQVAKLPALHKDLFDRILICQAIDGALTIVTPDDLVRQYPVPTVW